MMYNKQVISKMFGCSMEQLNKQYFENAKILTAMKNKAHKTGKKVNGFTESQLSEMASRYSLISGL